MSLIQSAISSLNAPYVTTLLLCFLILNLVLYRRFFHPLADIPAPPIAAFTSLFLYTICYLGIEGRVLAKYHRRYGTTVLRIAPNAVSIANGADLNTIYFVGGGFPKDARYRNFRVEGHDTIFSAVDASYRDLRAKAVAPLFAQHRIREAGRNNGVLQRCMDKFIARFEKEKRDALESSPDEAKVDILDLAARLSIDVTTGYLFNAEFGGLDENSPPPSKTSSLAAGKLSLTPFILAITSFGRFSLLPNWLFTIIFSLWARIVSDTPLLDAMGRLNNYIGRLIDNADPDQDGSYQARLLAARISKAETEIQCKAVTFAGTDSTAVKLATILFHLVQNPQVCAMIRRESKAAGHDADPQTLPYLRAVIHEGLRLGVANPVRLTRTVPPTGLDIGPYHLPGGTNVGAAAYVLHHNPEVYPAPFKFQPERWLNEQSEKDTRRASDRDWIPFGLGSRVCIGRNLATYQLLMATRAVAESGVLHGAKTCKENIEIYEWFNAEIKGHELEIMWNSQGL